MASHMIIADALVLVQTDHSTGVWAALDKAHIFHSQKIDVMSIFCLILMFVEAKCSWLL